MYVEIKGLKLEEVPVKELASMIKDLHDSVYCFMKDKLTKKQMKGMIISVKEVKNTDEGFSIELTGNK